MSVNVDVGAKLDLNRVLEQILGPLMEMWRKRNERHVSQDTGMCTLWQDGMVFELKAIARGNAPEATYKNLQKKFDQSKEPVKRAMERLGQARFDSMPVPIKRKIDDVLNSELFGKTFIREEIELILKRPGNENNKELAERVCGAIQRLNDELAELNDMVCEAERQARQGAG